MMYTNHYKKHSIWKIFIPILFMNGILLGLIFWFNHPKADTISNGEVAKLFVYSIHSQKEISEQISEKSGYWYDDFLRLFADSEHIYLKNGSDSFTWKDMYNVYTKLDEEYHFEENNTEIILPDSVPQHFANSKECSEMLNKKKNDKSAVPRNVFFAYYHMMLPHLPQSSRISKIEMAVTGTPSTLTGATKETVYTTKGAYSFTGLFIEPYIDKMIEGYACEQELLAISNTSSDTVTYHNIWIKRIHDNTLDANLYGANRTFHIQSVNRPVENTLADISLKDGHIVQIQTKTDEIGGKVLSVTNEYVEIEGYGKVPLDTYFMIYDIQNGFSIKTYKDIVVGYSLQKFIVAEGKICGGVVNQPLNADTIRVLIKTNGFENIFHDTVTITSEQSFFVATEHTSTPHNANEVVTFSLDSPDFADGRVSVQTQNDGKIWIQSLQRGYGIPYYGGKMELSLYEEGITIVNELPIEQYLTRVVPSEMPTSFGVEALKVQAVCARSYAYRQLTNDYYSMYGAHVDDSTLYQVYNNSAESQEANQAVADTSGLVLKYGEEVVQTYYYSTSCGQTTDVSLWGTAPENYPYFQAKRVSRNSEYIDLTDENAFAAFITNKDAQDYDAEYPLYRWQLTASVQELSDTFNAKLHNCYAKLPERILTQQQDGTFQSQDINSVGEIQDISVVRRVNGGAAVCVIVTGTQAAVQIDSESMIRTLFGMEQQEMITNTGTTKMASLPSTFCIFRKVQTENGIAFQITGGGYGHGIGMSQNAVHTMTLDGMNFVQILTFFYPGTEVARLTDVK